MLIGGCCSSYLIALSIACLDELSFVDIMALPVTKMRFLSWFECTSATSFDMHRIFTVSFMFWAYAMNPIIYAFCWSSTFVGTMPANRSSLKRFTKPRFAGSFCSSFACSPFPGVGSPPSFVVEGRTGDDSQLPPRLPLRFSFEQADSASSSEFSEPSPSAAIKCDYYYNSCYYLVFLTTLLILIY